MAQEHETRSDLAEESRPQTSRVKHCEVCGVSGFYIEVRDIWIDGMYFGTFCGKCEFRRGTGRPSAPQGDVRKTLTPLGAHVAAVIKKAGRRRLIKL
jgi:hypothetical protein